MTNWIDVSVATRYGRPRWPDNPLVILERFLDLGHGNDCNMWHLAAGVQSGMHMDGPVHFIHEAAGLDEMSLAATMGGAVRLLVVGGGPAGVFAALQARELGEDVTLLEAEQVGGTNWNRGPAPVRTMARAARLVRESSSWAGFGLEGPPPVPNLEAVLANSTRVAHYVHDKKDMAGHLRRGGIDLVDQLGPVRFTGPHTVQAEDGRSCQGDRIIVTVGCRAAQLPVPGGDLALTYNDIVTLKALPREVAVIGGADTGCQMASIFADFGVSVRLFEAGPALVPSADASISAALRAAFDYKGIQVLTGTRVQNIEGSGEQFIVRFSYGDTVERCDVGAVFAAVGWPANLDHLDLDAAGVTSNRQAIPVDDYLRTNVEHIFAAGDVNGRSKLVQTARIEGRLAAWNAIRGPSRQPAYDAVPSGSFTDPEYGAVGLTESQAARDHDIAVGIVRYDDLLRAVADGHPDGFSKLIADRRSRRILGAHVLGNYSAEIVQVVATAMSAGMNVEQLAEMQFAFPTFTEAVSLAAQKACRDIGIGQFPPAWSSLQSLD